MVPTGNVEVVKVAMPPLKAPVPSTVVPSLNVTVSPSGGEPSLEVTTAVKVTACPYVDGFGQDESEVAVAACFTTCFTVIDVLTTNFEPTPYTALV